MANSAIETTHPLTSVQQGMLFHFLEAPTSGVDIEQMIARVPSDVRVRDLELAFAALTRRHAALRSFFRWEGLDRPEQVVLRDVEVALVEHDLRTQPREARAAAFDELLRNDRRRGVTLSEIGRAHV